MVLALEDIFNQGQYTDQVLERILKSNKKWGARDRRFVAESVYEIVRWWRYLGVLAGSDPTKTPPTREQIWQIWGAWCFNTYHQLPEWSDLEAFDKEAFEERKKNISSVAVKESIPDWLYEMGREQVGPEWDEVLAALNHPAEVFLRVNTLKATREEVIRKLQNENIDVLAVPGVESALRLSERKNVSVSASFKEGYFEIQDAASQMVAPLLKVSSGQKVIDACAGGGGKSLHIAAMMKNKGQVIAMDVHQWKLNSLLERAARNRVGIIQTKLIDSPEVIQKLASTADRLLLDVPCSGLGVLRRNPDAKWKLSPEEMQRTLELQTQILNDYSQMVKPGGMMVYATCSVMPAENQDQVNKFLKTHADGWKLVEQIHVLPNKQGFDGFYGALLERKA